MDMYPTEKGRPRNTSLQLDEIRVLVLSPTPHPLDGKIQCQLSTFHGSTDGNQSVYPDALSNCPSYEVLSYSCLPSTPPKPRSRIWLDNQLVTVSGNLHLALCGLQKRTEWAQMLWADELCASVRDLHGDEEVQVEVSVQDKAAQMRMRKEVVKGASGVIVCLDDTEYPQKPGAGSLGALELVNAMMDQNYSPLARTAAKTAEVQGVVKYLNGGRATRETKAVTEELWETITRLCHMQHWNQISTIQHLFFACSVKLQYGTKITDAEDLVTFLSQYSRLFEQLLPSRVHGRVSESQFWRLQSHMDTKTRSDSHVTADFLSLLQLSSKCASTDGRDKVYAILGLACDIKESDIGFDYSISLFDLFCKIINHFQFYGRPRAGVNMVALCQALQHLLFGPDFNDDTVNEMAASRRALTTSSQITLPIKPCGKIVGVSDDPEDLLGYMVMMESLQRSSLSRLYYSTFQSDRRRNPKPWRDLLLKSWEKDSACFAIDEDEARKTKTKTKTSSAESPEGVTMFVTEDLHLGVAPRGIRKGDILCRFEGPDAVPFHAIARKVELGEPKGSVYRIVGRARVEGETSFKDAVPTSRQEKELKSKRWSSLGSKNPVFEVEIRLPILQALTCPLRSDAP